jgi:hypothetical protein
LGSNDLHWMQILQYGRQKRDIDAQRLQVIHVGKTIGEDQLGQVDTLEPPPPILFDPCDGVLEAVGFPPIEALGIDGWELTPLKTDYVKTICKDFYDDLKTRDTKYTMHVLRVEFVKVQQRILREPVRQQSTRSSSERQQQTEKKEEEEVEVTKPAPLGNIKQQNFNFCFKALVLRKRFMPTYVEMHYCFQHGIESDSKKWGCIGIHMEELLSFIQIEYNQKEAEETSSSESESAITQKSAY